MHRGGCGEVGGGRLGHQTLCPPAWSEPQVWWARSLNTVIVSKESEIIPSQSSAGIDEQNILLPSQPPTVVTQQSVIHFNAVNCFRRHRMFYSLPQRRVPFGLLCVHKPQIKYWHPPPSLPHTHTQYFSQLSKYRSQSVINNKIGSIYHTDVRRCCIFVCEAQNLLSLLPLDSI